MADDYNNLYSTGWGQAMAGIFAGYSSIWSGIGNYENKQNPYHHFVKEIEGYRGSDDPFEQMIWNNWASAKGIGMPLPEEEWFPNPYTGEMITTRVPEAASLQHMLSRMVVNPMGYKPNEKGQYTIGELGYIYQMTPARDVARQVQAWKASGQNYKAFLMEQAYGGTRRPEGEGIDVIRRLIPKYGHGQVDVEMNPELVQTMLARRATERRRPMYKGGTVTTGLLTSPALGFKRTLGG